MSICRTQLPVGVYFQVSLHDSQIHATIPALYPIYNSPVVAFHDSCSPEYSSSLSHHHPVSDIKSLLFSWLVARFMWHTSRWLVDGRSGSLHRIYHYVPICVRDGSWIVGSRAHRKSSPASIGSGVFSPGKFLCRFSPILLYVGPI